MRDNRLRRSFGPGAVIRARNRRSTIWTGEGAAGFKRTVCLSILAANLKRTDLPPQRRERQRFEGLRKRPLKAAQAWSAALNSPKNPLKTNSSLKRGGGARPEMRESGEKGGNRRGTVSCSKKMAEIAFQSA